MLTFRQMRTFSPNVDTFHRIKNKKFEGNLNYQKQLQSPYYLIEFQYHSKNRLYNFLNEPK